MALATKRVRYSLGKKLRSVGELAQKISTPNPSEISPSQTLFINLLPPLVIGGVQLLRGANGEPLVQFVRLEGAKLVALLF
jgi:hypothetical protein